MACPNCNPKFNALSDFRQFGLLKRLRSRIHPSPAEVTQINNLLRSGRNDITRYEDEILRLQGLVVSMQNEQRTLEAYMTKCQALLAPVRKLPNELLARIFAACRDSNKISNSGYSNLPGVSFEKVSSHWRAMALSTPALWSSIRLGFYTNQFGGYDMAEERKHAADVLRAVLRRSRTYPLDIDLNVDCSNVSEQTLFVLLCKESYRWRSLRFESLSFDSEAFDPIKGNVPILEHLSLSHSGEFEAGAINIFAVAPSLRSIRYLSLRLDRHELPWEGIVSLECYRQTLHDVFLALPRFSALERLSVQFTEGFGPPTSLDSPLLMPSSLRSLSVNVFDVHYGREYFKCLFDSLAISSLTSLTVRQSFMSPDVLSDWPTASFLSFIHRSGCTITSLCIDRVKIWMEELKSVLQLLPSLVEFTFNDVTPRLSLHQKQDSFPFHFKSASLVRDMCLYDLSREKPLLPNLKHLSLSLCAVEFKDDILLDMVKSRWREYSSGGNEGACLESFRLHLRDRKISAQGLRGLAILRRAGMRVSASGTNRA